MGIGVKKSDVQLFFKDKKLMNELIKRALDDPEIVKDLASDAADKMSDLLEDDPEFKKQIVEAATTRPELKKEVIQRLVTDMN